MTEQDSCSYRRLAANPAFVGAAIGCDLLIVSVGVYIRLMFYDSLRVPPLRRVPFGKQPQKEPKRPCPSVRPSLRSGSLSPVPLRGHAVTGHPWPNTTLPASCRETHCAKPTLGLPKGPVDQKQSKNAVRFGSKKSTAAT